MGRALSVLGICSTVVLGELPALANEPQASDYTAISYMYYSIIIGILGWGAYDTFFRKS